MTNADLKRWNEHERAELIALTDGADDGVSARLVLLFAISRDGFEVVILDFPIEPNAEPTMLETVQASDAERWSALALDLTPKSFNLPIRQMKTRGEIIAFPFGPRRMRCLVPSISTEENRNTRRAIIDAHNRVLAQCRAGVVQALFK